MSNLCDGSTYIINLSTFIRSHEAQLANALLAYKRSSTSTDPSGNVQRKNSNHKPVRLSLTLHHLYFLLDSFNQIGLKSGPLNIRLYDIDHDYTMNYETSHYNDNTYEQEYVSFLSNNYYNSKSKRLSNYSSSINSNDNSSITSISSVKSALSSIWNSISISNYGLAGGPYDSNIADNPIIISHLKYLYSCFTKLPCLRLSPDLNSKLIKNYQEFPFDTIIPLTVFKNLSILEINELNPKEIFGWHSLAELLKFLIIKNVDLSNKIDVILIDLLWQDYNNRNHKLMQGNASHAYTNSLPSSSPNSPLNSTFSNEKKKLTKKRHKSFANIRKKRNSNETCKKPLNPESHHPSSPKNINGSYNEYPTLTNPFFHDKWKNLRYLSFTNANLQSLANVECFQLLENLNSLDLSGNKLNEIPSSLKYLTNLKSLNLSDNMIKDLSNFRCFVKDGQFSIKTLSLINLKNNQITDLEGLEFLIHLTKIDLSYNKLNYLKNLKSLFLSGIEISSEAEMDAEASIEVNDSNILTYENLDVLNDSKSFAEIRLLPNKERVRLASLNLVGNPLQAFDKNYRIKLFNLCKVFNWVKQGIKINGSVPSYLESYYLINDNDVSNVDQIFNNTTSQLYLNFKKYLFDKDNYFHQFKIGDSIETFSSEHQTNPNQEVNGTISTNPGILKSISNYSLHIFAKEDAKKKKILSDSGVDKENENTHNDDNYLVNSISLLKLENKHGKTFPETFNTKPIPVNIQNNKLYLYNGTTRSGYGHAHSNSVKSVDTTTAIFNAIGNGTNVTTAAISPTSASFYEEPDPDMRPILINNEDDDLIKSQNEYKLGSAKNNYSLYNNSYTNHNSTSKRNTNNACNPRPARTNGMSTSRSLNNLLNLSHSLNVEATEPATEAHDAKTFNNSIRANTAFDDKIYNNKKHERTRSAISYHSTNTITE